ncbi:MAG: hypothetical protein H0Z37_02700 [Firmicutes bacterium]|nr:hypothetical protein [Bacillota bacterium]
MLLGALVLVAQAAFPISGAAAGKAVVLLVDGLSVNEFLDPRWTHLRRAAQGGVIGLMNARTAAATSPAAAHVTLGAGARARAGRRSGLAFDAGGRYQGQPVQQLYESLTGAAAGDDAVLFLGLAELQAVSAELPDRVVPGSLGQAVRDAGGRVAVIGNSDLFDAFRRHGVLLAMDAQGRVPLGSVSRELLASDPGFPFGRRTDYDATWEALAAVYPAADLIVVELGDLARLDAYRDWLSPGRFADLQDATLSRVDRFVGRLLDWSPALDTWLLVIAPTPPAPELRENLLLSPFLWTRIGGGASLPRLATSATTRRAGIVANTDIPPTILAALDVPPPPRMVGRPVVAAAPEDLIRDWPPPSAPPADPWEALTLIFRRAALVRNLRPPAVQAFIGLSIAVFVAWIAWKLGAAALGVPGPESRPALWRWVLSVLVAAPLAILLLPVAAAADPATAGLTLAGLTAGLAAVAAGATRRAGPDPFVLLALVTTIALVLDAVRGAPLIKSSILGYDPIVGARYYGIGNEYMGVLIASTLVGTTGLIDRARRPSALRWAVAAVYGGVVAVLASPGIGANVGGTVAATAGLAVTLVLIWNWPISWKTGVAVAAIVFAILAAAAAFDVAVGGNDASHLGRAAARALAGGWDGLAGIAIRKIQMNVRLLRWTIWSQVLVAALAVSAVALYRPIETIRRLDRAHPNLMRGIRGAVVASRVALVANDSGVVAAATTMIPATATLLYLAVDSGRDRSSPLR